MVNVIIAEDDLELGKKLQQFLAGLPNFNIVAVAEDGEAFIQLVATHNPDIALVDMDLPKLNGIQAYQACKHLVDALHVIFISENDQFALEAFDVGALDYIVKPVDRERLYIALNKYPYPCTCESNKMRELTIKYNNGMRFIPYDEIVFIEKIGRKTIIHTVKGIYETNDSLLEYEKNLDNRFMVSHRSNIINLDKLRKIEVNGQMYIAYFKNYDKAAKISKHKLNDIKLLKQ